MSCSTGTNDLATRDFWPPIAFVRWQDDCHRLN